MKKSTKILILCLSLVLVLGLGLTVFFLTRPNTGGKTPPDAPPPDRENKLIGICVPDQTQAWTEAAARLRAALEEKGYRVELAFGDGTPQGQSSVMETLLHKPVDCLVIAPADSAALTGPEKIAKEQGIPLLAYGVLLMNTDAVSGYVCYDYAQMGAQTGRRIAARLNLDGGETHTFEMFMGAPKDYNALLFHKGLMSVLQDYIDKNLLLCPSGRVAFEDCCTPDWTADTAVQIFQRRLQSSANQVADVYFCASDNIAAGVIAGLEKAGVPAMPLVTGSGATQEGRTLLSGGKLTLTLSTDWDAPASACVDLADRVLFGTELPMEHTLVNNNVSDIPTILCGFEVLEKE